MSCYLESAVGVSQCSDAHTILTRSVQNGSTALIVAAENGHVTAVELLVEAKAQVNIQQKVKFTACR